MFWKMLRHRSVARHLRRLQLRPGIFCSFSAQSEKTLTELQHDYRKEIEALPEQTAVVSLETFLEDKCNFNSQNLDRWNHIAPPIPPIGGYKYLMDTYEINMTLDAAMATFCLHVESRIAALVGKGFYTIGPCGEELLSAIGISLEEQDDAALHYRHLGVSLARQIKHRGQSEAVFNQVLLDRARGYTVSKMDPVTGGVHCSIGSHQGPKDYLVTSTLASQCTPAVGRALGYSLASKQQVPGRKTPGKRAVSFVSVGDGSVHNHHFWSAFHLARHAKHRSIQCPVVFGISNNGMSISYETKDYVNTLFGDDSLVSLFTAEGSDMMSVYDQTKQATQYARQRSAPAVVLYQKLTRRFGHAASDRQLAYLTAEQIQAMADSNVLERAIVQAVEVYNACTYSEVKDRFEKFRVGSREAFVLASQEDKVTRQEMMDRVAQPMVSCPRLPAKIVEKSPTEAINSNSESTRTVATKPEVMRKHMNRVLNESLEADPSVVYLGEDVEHGGYYLVTDQLAELFPGRVVDFPPDETSLLGAAMGFSQVGLTPIVEIPYAKYLDCGADMFYEIGITNWLSAGQQPNGMIIRLQGFDRGLFGGNFHTHNMLSNMPPGVDVVCYSNGEDYVRGFRHALAQAKAGRVVVSVDSTALLNQRHLHDNDRGWERPYPTINENDGTTDLMSFHDIIRYGTNGTVALVTYGNGVITALQSRKALLEKGAIKSEDEMDIIDCPCLSMVPDGVKEVMQQYKGVVFADICKDGPGSNVMSSMIVSLQSEGLLPPSWTTAFAPRTYNPLGSVETFLNADDIEMAWGKLRKTMD